MIGDKLASSISALHKPSPLAFVASFVGLLWGSLGVTNHLQTASAIMWGVPRQKEAGLVPRVLRGLLLLGTIAVAVVGSAILAGISTIGGVHDNAVAYWAYTLIGAGGGQLRRLPPGHAHPGPSGDPLGPARAGRVDRGARLDHPRDGGRPPGEPRPAARHRALRPLRHRARTRVLALPGLAALHVRRRDERRPGQETVAAPPRRATAGHGARPERTLRPSRRRTPDRRPGPGDPRRCPDRRSC